LGVAATGSSPFHAEARAERGFTDADDGLLSNTVESVAQPYGGGRLPFAGGRRVDGRDQDELTVLPLPGLCYEGGRDLRLVMAVGKKVLGRDAKLHTDLLDRLLICRTRDFDIGLHFGHRLLRLRNREPPITYPRAQEASLARPLLFRICRLMHQLRQPRQCARPTQL